MTNLTAEQIKTLYDARIGVTTGLGTGIGGSLMAAFMTSPLLVLSADSQMPDPQEIKLLNSYTEFKAATHWGPSVMIPHIPQGSGANPIIFIKYENGGWAYRRASWTYGPLFFPARNAPPLDLKAAILHEENLVPKRWLEWLEKSGL